MADLTNTKINGDLEVTGTISGDIDSIIPVASTTTLGGVKVGTNLSISDGVLSADAQSYILPTASATTLGGVKVGTNLSISDGVLSADAQSYILPTASATTLGGVKIGARLSITNGVLSATDQSYTLPTASATTLGGVKVGTNLSISDGVLSADAQSYILPTASTTTLGGVKVGTNLSISDGVLSVSGLNIKYVTPQDFGAKGDGYTEDTVAFNNAISFCIQNKYVLYITTGNYVVKALNQINSAVTIISDRKGTIYFKPTTQTDILFDIQNTSTLTNVILEGITIKPYPGAVQSSNFFGTVFKIQNTAFLRLFRIRIESNTASSVTYKFNTAITLGNSFQAIIEDCYISDCNFNLIECINRTSELYLNNVMLYICYPPHEDGVNADNTPKIPYDCNGCGLKITGNATGIYIIGTTIYQCFNGLYLEGVIDLFATQLFVDAGFSKNTYIKNCSGIKFQNSWFQATNYYWAPYPVIFIIDSKDIHILDSYIYDGVFDGCFISNSTRVCLKNNVITRHGQYILSEETTSAPASGVTIHNSDTVYIDSCKFTEGIRGTQLIRNNHGIKLVGRIQDVQPFKVGYIPSDPYVVSKNIIITNNYFTPYEDETKAVIYICGNTYTTTVIKQNMLNIQIKNNYGERVPSETGLIFSIKKTGTSEIKYKLEPLNNIDKELFVPTDTSLYYSLLEKNFSTTGVCKYGTKYILAGGGLQNHIGTVLKASIIQPVDANLFCKVYLGYFSDITNSSTGFRITFEFYNKDGTAPTLVNMEELMLTYGLNTEFKVVIEGIFI